jgi:hypothetical protein
MIPPKEGHNNWGHIFWWILIIAWVWLLVNMDTILTIIGFSGLSLLTIGVFARKKIKDWKYRKCPFDMSYQSTHRFKSSRNTEYSKVLPIGESHFTLRIQPRRTTIFEDIHVRLVNRLDWQSKTIEDKFPQRETIGVINMMAEGLIDNDLVVQEDHISGFDGKYRKPYERIPEDSLYLKVWINTNKVWDGYLMFQSKCADDHRGYAYLPLNVRGNQ